MVKNVSSNGPHRLFSSSIGHLLTSLKNTNGYSTDPFTSSPSLMKGIELDENSRTCMEGEKFHTKFPLLGRGGLRVCLEKTVGLPEVARV